MQAIRCLQAGLKHRKLGSSMSQQDSGNMLLLLSAVEDVKSMDRSAAEAKRQSGEAYRSHIDPDCGADIARELMLLSPGTCQRPWAISNRCPLQGCCREALDRRDRPAGQPPKFVFNESLAVFDAYLALMRVPYLGFPVCTDPTFVHASWMLCYP